MLRNLYDKFCKNLKKIAEIIGAIIVIVGALTGVCSWVSGQFANAVSDQISEFQDEMEEFQDEMEEANKKHEQSITRVELIALMEHDPYNLAAIEKMARYYFHDLDGDLYMTQRYSDWCKRYGGDPTIILKENK